MKNNIYFVLLAILILFVVSGCDKNEIDATDGPFNGGVKGLSISFVEGAPLSEFMAGEGVPFQILLKNEGENLVLAGDAKVQIFGINPNFGLSTEFVSNVGDLASISKDMEIGGEEIISLGEGNYVGTIYGSQTFPINARVCYPYDTIIVSTVCMSSNRIQQTGVETCDISGEKIVSGGVSSGPIQINSITETYLGSDSIRFAIIIENKGIGKVYSKDIECGNFNLVNEGKVYVDMSPEDVECHFTSGKANTGETTITEDLRTLICEKPVDATDSYQDNLDITLSYKYVNEVSTTVNVLGT
jgi:hypothetical protein